MRNFVFALVIFFAPISWAENLDDSYEQSFLEKFSEFFPNGLIELSKVKEFISIPLPITKFEVLEKGSNFLHTYVNYSLDEKKAPAPLKHVDLVVVMGDDYPKIPNSNNYSNSLNLKLDTNQICITKPMIIERFGTPTRSEPIKDRPLEHEHDEAPDIPGSLNMSYQFENGQYIFLYFSECLDTLYVSDRRNKDWTIDDAEIAEYTKFVKSYSPFIPSEQPLAKIGFKCRPNERMFKISPDSLVCTCVEGSTSKFCGKNIFTNYWDFRGEVNLLTTIKPKD